MHENCGDRPLLGTVLVTIGLVEGVVDDGLSCRPELDRAIARRSGVDLAEEAEVDPFMSGVRSGPSVPWFASRKACLDGGL
jgi:hypothetical protein